MDLTAVQKLADGRVYTARQAAANGLIDDLAADLNEAERKLCAFGNINYDSTDFINYSYEATETYLNKLLGISLRGSQAAKTIEILSGFGPYYYAYNLK